MENAKILLVDDEKEIREIIRITLEKEGIMNVEEAGSVYESIQKCRNCIYDLIILDILLPDGSGFDICKTLREITDAPIFFLTAKSSDLDKLSGFAMGADDYITKPFQPLEVVARVKAHLKRLQKNTYIGNGTQDNCSFNFGYFKVFEESAQLIVEGNQVPCPAMEFKLLLFLCKNPNRIYTRAQLYEQIWGDESMNDDNTVMVHIRRIREKIEKDPSNPKALVTIRGLGYKLIHNS